MTILVSSDSSATVLARRKIARGFCSGKYPLSAKGQELKQTIVRVLENNDDSWLKNYHDEIPTIENFHRDLYLPLNYGSFEKKHIIGKLLAIVQVNRGCIHQCYGFCSAAASPKIWQTMDFSAVMLLGDDKIEWDKEYWHYCHDWRSYLIREMRIDINKDSFREWMNSMPWKEFVCFVNCINDHKKSHPIKDYLNLYPIDEKVAERIWGKWWEFFPLNYGSFRQHIINFDDSDPLSYRTATLCHEDGSLADYSDVVWALATEVRPIAISTAGWLPGDNIAEKAVKKISKTIQKNPHLVDSFRLSIKKEEKLARTNFLLYLRNIERMICSLHPVHPDIEINYDPHVKGDREWAQELGQELIKFYEKKFGEKLEIPDLFHKSHFSGYAYDERYATEDFDPIDCVPGTHIRPNGTVDYREPAVWKELKTIEGKIYHRLGSPDSTPHFTGLKMW